MAMNKITKAIKLIMSHYKDVCKRDGIPVKSFSMRQVDFRTYLTFEMYFTKELSKDAEQKLNKRIKEFAHALNHEQPWLVCDEFPELFDDKLGMMVDCEINYPAYNNIAI